MPVLNGLNTCELWRIRFCQGCKHLGQVGEYGCCDYIFHTGHRRPCPWGEGCTEYAGGRKRHHWSVGPKTQSDPVWGNQKSGKPQKVWDREKAKALYESGHQIQEIIEAVGVSKSTINKERLAAHWERKVPLKRPPTNAPGWDTDLGRRMYEQGRTLRDIAEAVGVHYMTVTRRAAREGWKRGEKP